MNLAQNQSVEENREQEGKRREEDRAAIRSGDFMVLERVGGEKFFADNQHLLFGGQFDDTAAGSAQRRVDLYDFLYRRKQVEGWFGDCAKRYCEQAWDRVVKARFAVLGKELNLLQAGYTEIELGTNCMIPRIFRPFHEAGALLEDDDPEEVLIEEDDPGGEWSDIG